MSLIPRAGLAPFGEYKQTARNVWKSSGGFTTRLRYIIPIPVALTGFVVGVNSGLVGILGGLLGGLALGFVIAIIVESMIVQSKAKKLYLDDWCKKTGWQYEEEANLPDDHPLRHAGDRRRIGFGFLFNGGGIANIDIITEHTDSEGHTSTDTDHYVLCYLNTELPLKSMDMNRRHLLSVKLFDKMDSKVTNQRVLELESVEFHDKWKIQVDDNADDVLLRRVFSPKIIDGFINGKLDFACPVEYRNGRMWYTVKNEELDVDKLEADLEKIMTPIETTTNLLKQMFARANS